MLAAFEPGSALASSMAFFIMTLNSGSTITALASPWLSMKAIASGSRRVLREFNTAPTIGTPKWASTIGGVFGNITATVSPTPIPS